MIKKRILYGYPIGALAIAILVYGNWLLFATILATTIWCLIEFYELTGLRQNRKLFPMRRWGYILAIVILFLAYFNLLEYLDLAIVLFILAAFLYRLSNYKSEAGRFINDLAISILGGIFIGGCMSFFFRLHDLSIALRNSGIIPSGSAWLGTLPLLGPVLQHAGWTTGVGSALLDGPNWLVILPIMGSWGYDFCALFTGILLGKTPLAPSISPKKTIEGLVGGVIGCGTSIVLMAMIIGIDSRFYLFLFILGMVMGTFSQLGDLCMSSLKREAGVKDSFRFGIPGHGGMLDKCDGLLFVLPLSYYVVFFALKIIGAI